jgi:hypothetical protein
MRSRFGAYGIGTSAPAILSTGASRYSKLSSTTDILYFREWAMLEREKKWLLHKDKRTRFPKIMQDMYIIYNPKLVRQPA